MSLHSVCFLTVCVCFSQEPKRDSQAVAGRRFPYFGAYTRSCKILHSIPSPSLRFQNPSCPSHPYEIFRVHCSRSGRHWANRICQFRVSYEVLLSRPDCGNPTSNVANTHRGRLPGFLPRIRLRSGQRIIEGPRDPDRCPSSCLHQDNLDITYCTVLVQYYECDSALNQNFL